MGRRRHKLIFIGVCALVLIAVFLTYWEDIRETRDRWHGPFLNPEPASSLKSPTDIFASEAEQDPPRHPIEDLIERARVQTEAVLKKRTYNLSTAAAAYRQRRGRHPPPGFDRWVDFALEHNVYIIEDFFDQIHRDIEPFWAVDAGTIRAAAAALPNVIQVREGRIRELTNEWSFVDAYVSMVAEIEHLLPDVDLPINEMDESRILVPWEDINELITSSSDRKDLLKTPSIIHFDSLGDDSEAVFHHTWIHEGPYWDLVRKGCAPQSPARTAVLDADFSTPPRFPTTWPQDSWNGFVLNWTNAKDPCIHAHLRNMHGSFVEPISQSTSTTLVPMFSGSKMPFNNDILLPGAVYWREDDRFSSKSARVPWSRKRTEALWRGSASGGRNTEHNWTRFQRHRLLSMLNGTQIQMTLDAHDSMTTNLGTTGNQTHQGDDMPLNFPLPNQSAYPLRSHSQGLLPDWIRSLSNAAFTWLVCFPATVSYACSYTGSWYRRGGEMPLHRMFQAKFLPDVDGNSFSGRYRAFLTSNSLPIKATIYSEWHDDRLIAWQHFVPMDNTFVDLWAILEYFVSHDERAQQIALEGHTWADQVLRKEDMLAYVYRLILEYARVSSKSRHEMGWTPDSDHVP